VSKTKSLICIRCPIGCNLEVTIDNNNITVTGNQCKRGENYAKTEITNPTRILTSTVKVSNGELKRLPVRTKESIPKDKIFEAMSIINKVTVEAPIKVGDIIIKNILDTNIDVIATRSISKIKEKCL